MSPCPSPWYSSVISAASSHPCPSACFSLLKWWKHRGRVDELQLPPVDFSCGQTLPWCQTALLSSLFVIVFRGGWVAQLSARRYQWHGGAFGEGRQSVLREERAEANWKLVGYKGGRGGEIKRLLSLICKQRVCAVSIGYIFKGGYLQGVSKSCHLLPVWWSSMCCCALILHEGDCVVVEVVEPESKSVLLNLSLNFSI